jgi:MFS transporter, DHA1 family, multidrug resistance protein
MTEARIAGQSRSSLLLALLVLISMTAPLALNIILPSLPGFPVTFSTSKETAQLTLSLFLGAMGIAQLIIGPLADRLGRRPVLIGGLALFVLASLMATFATTISMLIIARIVQAFGAVAGITIARTIVRDVYPREQAASMIGYVTMGMVVAPMLAPALGGVLDETFGWRAIFIACAVLGLFALLSSIFALRETRPIDLQAATAREVVHRSSDLLKRRVFLGFAGSSAFASAMFFSFVGAAPYIVQDQLGLSKDVYGYWFASIAFGYMVGNFFSGRYSQRIGLHRMILTGNALGLLAAIVMTGLSLAGYFNPAAIFLPAMLMSIGNGLVLPNAIAGAVSVDPKAVGAASGLTGFLQTGIGGIGSFIAGAISGVNALNMALLMLVFSLLALLTAQLALPPACRNSIQQNNR